MFCGCLGAPGSGKGTQCEKLVEEFGYQHISTGDLMRIEAKKGTREGDRIKQIMDQGKLIPTELIVQVLIDAMLANPSQVSYHTKNSNITHSLKAVSLFRRHFIFRFNLNLALFYQKKR